MKVTSGFYVRSLCQDLGAAIGSLGMMTELVRTQQGDFVLGTNVLWYEELKQGEDVWGPKVRDLLEDWDRKQKRKAKSSSKEERGKGDEATQATEEARSESLR